MQSSNSSRVALENNRCLVLVGREFDSENRRVDMVVEIVRQGIGEQGVHEQRPGDGEQSSDTAGEFHGYILSIRLRWYVFYQGLNSPGAQAAIKNRIDFFIFVQQIIRRAAAGYHASVRSRRAQTLDLRVEIAVEPEACYCSEIITGAPAT